MLPCPSRRGPGCPALCLGGTSAGPEGKQRGTALGKLAGRCQAGERVQGFMTLYVEIQGVSQLTAVSSYAI